METKAISYWYVYILKCNVDKLYTGCTSNLKKRMKAHANGNVKSTKDRLPFQLISVTAFIDEKKAYKYEKYLKSGSGRAFAKKHLL
jgi:putative endonuclease